MRHEIQQYANIAAIIADSIAKNSPNDIVSSKADRALFVMDSDSGETADGEDILQQTAETGTARFHRIIAVKKSGTGTANAPAIANGNYEPLDITVTGADSSKGSIVSITNATALNAIGIYVESKEVVSANTVRVKLANQSGIDIAAGTTVNVKLTQF